MRHLRFELGLSLCLINQKEIFFFFPKVPTHLHGHRGLGHQGLASWSQKWEYCQTRKLLPWSQGKSGEEAYVSFHKPSYSPLSKSILLFSLFINKHPPTPLFFMVYPKDLWIILIVTQPTILTVFIWHEARIFQGTLIRKKHKKKAHTRDRIFQYPESQQSFKTGFVKRKKSFHGLHLYFNYYLFHVITNYCVHFLIFYLYSYVFHYSVSFLFLFWLLV